MRDAISKLVESALDAAIAAGDLVVPERPDPALERPRDPSHGDWATSVALRSAKLAGKPPREVAEVVARHLEQHDDIAAVEIAGPGFINLRLSPTALQRVLRIAHDQDRDFGRTDSGAGRRVQVEFVSANPVGPMHVGHGRWAALGDSMARILAHTGWQVEREFYVNDAGVQMDLFAASVAARYVELCGGSVQFPENGYQGAYIGEIAHEIYADEGMCWLDASQASRETHFREKAYAQVLAHLKKVLHDFGVDFDVWFSERTVHAPTADGGPSGIESAIAQLRERGFIYESEGAVWFRSTDFDDDKDRVLLKADGSYTYFAADIAYHKDKFDRGFDRVINIWGADHHGYVARMKAAAAALGHEGKLDLVIGQLVNLFRDGEAVRMSKRTGEMVTFEELLDEVGADAARYWFLRRSTDQQVDFDIAVAKQQSADNPVYYVQYAHARICSILRKAAQAEEGVHVDDMAAEFVSPHADLSPLTAPAELALMRKLDEFPEVVEVASRELAPYKVARYAEDLAAVFHQFYAQCRVVDPSEPHVSAARLFAVDATRRTLRCALDLLGVDAPSSM